MEDTLTARGLHLQEVSDLSGIPIDTLEEIIFNDQKIDERIAIKLDIVFPDARHILIGIQKNYQYFLIHRNWRPRSAGARLWESFVDLFAA